MPKKKYEVLLIDSSMSAELCRQMFIFFVNKYLPPEKSAQDIKWANETCTKVKEKITESYGRVGYFIPLSHPSDSFLLSEYFYQTNKHLCEVFNASYISLGKIH